MIRDCMQKNNLVTSDKSHLADVSLAKGLIVLLLLLKVGYHTEKKNLDFGKC